jgi:hypothetical protein
MNIFVEAYKYKSLRYLIPVHVAMVLKALTCLVKNKNKNNNKHKVSACPFKHNISISKDHSESRIILFRLSFSMVDTFIIHGRLSGQFSGSPAAFGKLKQAP